MSDLERRVKRSIDSGEPRAAIALAVLSTVEPLARIADATERIAHATERIEAVLEGGDEEEQS